MARAKGLHNEPHPAMQPRHLSQNLGRPHTAPQSAVDHWVGPLGPGWDPPATLSDQEPPALSGMS